MKKRSGFVANSSRSSFVLAFPCMAHTLPVSSLRELLYRGQESVTIGEYVHSTEEIAGIILRQLKSFWNTSEVKNPLIRAIAKGYLEDAPSFGIPDNWSKMKLAEKKKFWRDYSTAQFQYAMTKADQFREEHASSFFYVLEYEDKGSVNIYLHNGDAFRNIPHIRVSNH